MRPVLLAVALLALFLLVRAQPLDSIEQRYLNAGEIFAELGAHVRLTLISTVCTIAIALPLGILLTRPGTRWARPIGLGLGNLGQAIPSIGLVVLLALWTGTGTTTAVTALVVYATLPVLRNTIVGLDGVDPTLVDAARGMGMTGRGDPLADRTAAGRPGDPRRDPDGAGAHRRERRRWRPSSTAAVSAAGSSPGSACTARS